MSLGYWKKRVWISSVIFHLLQQLHEICYDIAGNANFEFTALLCGRFGTSYWDFDVPIVVEGNIYWRCVIWKIRGFLGYKYMSYEVNLKKKNIEPQKQRGSRYIFYKSKEGGEGGYNTWYVVILFIHLFWKLYPKVTVLFLLHFCISLYWGHGERPWGTAPRACDPFSSQCVIFIDFPELLCQWCMYLKFLITQNWRRQHFEIVFEGEHCGIGLYLKSHCFGNFLNIWTVSWIINVIQKEFYYF